MLARTRLLLVGAVALLLIILACLDLGRLTPHSTRLALPSPPQPAAPSWYAVPELSDDAMPSGLEAPSSADLVIVISIDGLRPDVITSSMRALHKLSRHGASPRVARTIDQSETLPSHASMVSGVAPSEHGLDFNVYKPAHGNISRPTMFSLTKAARLPTLMFVAKPKLRHLLNEPNDAELKVAGMRCRDLVREAAPKLKRMNRGLLFMHFADPDAAGHRHGWMSDRYVAAARDADACVGEVMDAIQQGRGARRTLLLVTADHGGHGRGHGTRMEVDQRIPWYAWGAGARRGRIRRTVHTTDTAATVLAALGIEVPAFMQGKPVAEAIEAALGPAGMPLVGEPLQLGAPKAE